MNPERPLITNKTELRFFGSLGLFLIVLILLSLIVTGKFEKKELTNELTKIENKNPFDSIKINAKAAYVYDVRNQKVLFEKNSKERLPLASVTKVMTAVVASDIAPMDQIITITPEAIRAEGDSGLSAGERWTLRNLLDFSLTSSSNDGAKAIAIGLGAHTTTNPNVETAENDFINSMNLKASELGMLNTYFFNETGLDETNKKSGAYGSAEDMSKMFTYILRAHPNLLEATTHQKLNLYSEDNKLHTAINTDKIVALIPGIKGSKTGFTDIAGGNLVIAFDPELGRPIIISVLGSTMTERFNDVSKLVTATLKEISIDRQK